MRKIYEKPQSEIVEFISEGIIASSSISSDETPTIHNERVSRHSTSYSYKQEYNSTLWKE